MECALLRSGDRGCTGKDSRCCRRSQFGRRWDRHGGKTARSRRHRLAGSHSKETCDGSGAKARLAGPLVSRRLDRRWLEAGFSRCHPDSSSDSGESRSSRSGAVLDGRYFLAHSGRGYRDSPGEAGGVDDRTYASILAEHHGNPFARDCRDRAGIQQASATEPFGDRHDRCQSPARYSRVSGLGQGWFCRCISCFGWRS